MDGRKFFSSTVSSFEISLKIDEKNINIEDKKTFLQPLKKKLNNKSLQKSDLNLNKYPSFNQNITQKIFALIRSISFANFSHRLSFFLLKLTFQ